MTSINSLRYCPRFELIVFGRALRGTHKRILFGFNGYRIPIRCQCNKIHSTDQQYALNLIALPDLVQMLPPIIINFIFFYLR